MKEFWIPGERAQICKKTGISQSHLGDILKRRRGVSKERAMILDKASRRRGRKPVTFTDWLFNKTTRHPAFFGKPKPTK